MQLLVVSRSSIMMNTVLLVCFLNPLVSTGWCVFLTRWFRQVKFQKAKQPVDFDKTLGNEIYQVGHLSGTCFFDK